MKVTKNVYNGISITIDKSISSFISIKYIFFSIGIMIFLPINISAQGLGQLGALVKQTETISNPKISDNGNWTAWYALKNDFGESKVIVASIKNPKRRFLRDSVSRWKFGGNQISLKTDKGLEILDLADGRSSYFEEVKSSEYVLEDGLWLVHYNDKKTNKLELYDPNMKLINSINQVKFFLKKEEDLFVIVKKEKENLVFILDKRKLRQIYSTENNVLNVWTSKLVVGGWILSESSPEGVAATYLSKEYKVKHLSMSGLKGFEQMTVENSVDPNDLFLSFGKIVRPVKEDVQIWYGKERDLTRYTSGYVDFHKVVWNPITDRKSLVSDGDFMNETSIGKQGLMLRMLVDKDKVENRDSRSGRVGDQLFVLNSKTGKSSFLSDVHGKLVIHPNGNLVAVNRREGWFLFDVISGEAATLTNDTRGTPYFYGSENMIWIVDGKILLQNLKTLRNKTLANFGNIQVEILNIIVQHTRFGYGRHFGSVDPKHSLLLKLTDDERGTVRYVEWKDGETKIIVESTTDHIYEFQKAQEKDVFIWFQENYNRPTALMGKSGGASVVSIYTSNKNFNSLGSIQKIVVDYKGADGKDLRGTLFLPERKDDSVKYPIVTHIYEIQHHLTNRFLKASFLNTLGFNEALLLESGFGVFLPDISYGNKGPALSALESMNNAMDELIKVKNVDSLRIGLMGQSFGGYETSFIAAHSKRFAAYVSGAPVTDIVRMYYGFNKGFSAPDYWRVEGRQYEFNVALPDDMNKYFRNSPLLFAQNVQAPVLLWTGTADTNVDFEHTRSLFLALRKYRKPVVGLFYKDEQHSLMQQSNQKDLTLKVIEWWDYFLKDKKDVPWIDRQMKSNK